MKREPTTLLCDIHEPQKELAQDLPKLISPPYSWGFNNLNDLGLADYLMVAADGHTVQIERKQAGELLSDLDSVEAQLAKEMIRADETTLAIEGIITPAPQGCFTWQESRDGRLFIRRRAYKVNYAELGAWVWQLDKCGITVLQYPNWDSFLTGLVAIYKNLQKPEHTTLRRYIKPKIQPPQPNPYVETLMGIRGINREPLIGPETAQKLIDNFDTPWEVIHRPPEHLMMIPGLGKQFVMKLYRALGIPTGYEGGRYGQKGVRSLDSL